PAPLFLRFPSQQKFAKQISPPGIRGNPQVAACRFARPSAVGYHGMLIKNSFPSEPMQNLLDKLNPEQRLAAETIEGPVLILAGAGTGKTRALTFRMANLISRGAPGESILAVTFTNKAAEEMQNRVTGLLLRAGVPPARPWISTFHSLCARLLHREAAHAGLPKDFAIYDDDDQLSAVKLVMARLNIEDDALTPRNVLSRISYAKNQAQSPEQVLVEAFGQDTRKVADIYAGYE